MLLIPPPIILPPPIIAPQTRECIVVDGKKFCRDDDISASGIALGVGVIVVIAAAWVIPILMLLEKSLEEPRFPARWAVMYGVGFPFVAALLLYLVGG